MAVKVISRRNESLHSQIDLTDPFLYEQNDNFIYHSSSEQSVYLITVNKPHVFPFTIQSGGTITICIAQIMNGMQDGSLVSWFSSSPLDQTLFSKYSSFDPISVTHSRPRQITLWDNSANNLPANALSLPPNTTYYFNVKNNQAKTNTYKLSFK